jgi:hypothetical protein
VKYGRGEADGRGRYRQSEAQCARVVCTSRDDSNESVGDGVRVSEIVGCSVRGPAHEFRNVPNQDACQFAQPQHEKLPIIAAVADGHGGSLHFRSHTGAKLAVDAALRTLGRVAAAGELSHPEAVTHEIVSAWRHAVSEDVALQPFLGGEIRSASHDGSNAEAELKKNPFVAYGATLLAVMITTSGILYLQLGDGDILIVSKAGEVIRAFPPDPRFACEATSSLCMPAAVEEFAHCFVSSVVGTPELVLLSTDGYSKSFQNDGDFLKIGKDYLDLIRRDGPVRVGRDLPRILSHTSQCGSGDDISLVMAYMGSREGNNGQEPTELARLRSPLSHGEKQDLANWGILLYGGIFAVLCGIAGYLFFHLGR